jgi:hypothetical protein
LQRASVRDWNYLYGRARSVGLVKDEKVGDRKCVVERVWFTW